jgi:hypothetical protein
MVDSQIPTRRAPAQEDWDLVSEVFSDDKMRWAIDGFGLGILIPKPGRDSYELSK